MNSLLYYFTLFFTYCYTEVSHSNKNDGEKSTTKGSSSFRKDELNVDSFQKEYPLLLKVKRREQDVALKTILLKNKDEKHLMLKHLFSSIHKTIKESKHALVKYNDNIDDFRIFGSTEETKEHFSRIVENTIFLAGLTLYFPKFASYYINKDVDFNQLYRWSNGFCSNLTFLDNETKEFLNLAAQEIGFVPKTDDFINPYIDISGENSNKKEEMQRQALEEMKEREMAKKLAKSNKPKKKKKINDSHLKSEL